MIRTAVIYVLVNSLVLTFERTLSATLLLGLVIASYLLNYDPKSPKRASFVMAERVGSHTCAISNAQGAQVCAVRKPDEPHKSRSGESLNKNKVCAGIEVVANDPTLSAISE